MRGNFNIWEQKEKTIKEVEEEFGESIAFFMRKNLLAKSEEDKVRRLYVKFDN
ncbi:MAG: hypothetical protein J6C25_10320 [Treponema sp.]|nr:hypothetical protein [Treponema sp.]MBP3562129.1 hypothetical protein [Treponema sp.]